MKAGHVRRPATPRPLIAIVSIRLPRQQPRFQTAAGSLGDGHNDAGVNDDPRHRGGVSPLVAALFMEGCQKIFAGRFRPSFFVACSRGPDGPRNFMKNPRLSPEGAQDNSPGRKPCGTDRNPPAPEGRKNFVEGIPRRRRRCAFVERASGLPCRHSWRHPLWSADARKKAGIAGRRPTPRCEPRGQSPSRFFMRSAGRRALSNRPQEAMARLTVQLFPGHYTSRITGHSETGPQRAPTGLFPIKRASSPW